MLPAAMSARASLRGALRLVGFELPYSRLRLAKPLAPSGSPTLPATLYASPSPAPKAPVLTSRVPPEAASLSWKFITPAMASEPYWAAAPSRSTSTCRSAMAGMAEMSGPCDPNATPLPPCQSMIDERWRRLPFTSTSVWSGARFRSIAGRTTVDASAIGCMLTLNDGMTVRSWSCRLTAPWLVSSVVERTSTGTGDAVTVRGCAREPTTTVSSVKPASSRSISSGESARASTSDAVMPRTRASSSIRGSVSSCEPTAGGPAVASRAEVGDGAPSRSAPTTTATDADHAHADFVLVTHPSLRPIDPVSHVADAAAGRKTATGGAETGRERRNPAEDACRANRLSL